MRFVQASRLAAVHSNSLTHCIGSRTQRGAQRCAAAQRRTVCSMATCSTVTHVIEDDGQFPNCSIQKLPLLVYKGAFEASGSPSQLANHIESTFETNGFPPQWRFGLFGGAKQGVEEEVTVGDVILIPAGIAHESLQAKGGFNMVGAYPAGCSWDMNYGKSQEEKMKAEANIKQVAALTKDPVYGEQGPVFDHWKH